MVNIASRVFTVAIKQHQIGVCRNIGVRVASQFDVFLPRVGRSGGVEYNFANKQPRRNGANRKHCGRDRALGVRGRPVSDVINTLANFGNCANEGGLVVGSVVDFSCTVG